MAQQIHRIAIVHRGEAATRLVDAVTELNSEPGWSLRTVALYTEPDRHALFVRRADEAVGLGPATVPDPAGGPPRPAYVDPARLEAALLESRADAAWPGWGFVAEAAWFAERCEAMGITFIGPSPAVLSRLADPAVVRTLAESADVATAPADLDPSRRLRHVEVPVVADADGTVWTLGVRDRTVQRRGFRVLVESACPTLEPARGDDLAEAARRLVGAAGLVGVGSVGFLVDPESGAWWLHGVVPRLQVGHGVTEAVAGVDLVKLQLHLAGGGRLGGAPPASWGHAVTVRISALDPSRDFAPAPGRLFFLRTPAGPGVRVDPGAGLGDPVPGDLDDPLVASIVAWGHDRAEAMARLRRAIRDTAVLLEGGATDKGFLLELLDRPELRSGDLDTGWLDRLLAAGELRSRHHADVALLQAAVDASDVDRGADQQRFLASAARGRPEVAPGDGRTVELRFGGHRYRLAVAQRSDVLYTVTTDTGPVDLRVEHLGPYERRLTVGGRTWRTLAAVRGPDHDVEVEGVPHHLQRDDGGVVRAPAPAVVVTVPVAPGDEVQAGDPLAVIETMKMELAVSAPGAGRVRTVLVRPNEQVDRGAPLVQLDPLHRASEEHTDRLQAAASPVVPVDPRERLERLAEELRALVLGYDVSASRARVLSGELTAVVAALPPHDPPLVRLETDVLDAFADVAAVARRQPAVDEEGDEHARSAQEHLFAFLRSPERARDTLPLEFLARLRRALAHYGIATLDRTPALEEAAYWLFRAQQRADQQLPVIAAVLERWLDQAELLGPRATDEQRALLDRLILASEGRHPTVGDLAREVRYHWVDLPVLEATRQAVEHDVVEHLDRLAAHPGEDDREDRIAALVSCPYPLHGLLQRWAAGKGPEARALEVEALTRRYYRIRDLEYLEVGVYDGLALARSTYRHEGSVIGLLATAGAFGDLGLLLARLRDELSRRPSGPQWVLDLYLDGPAPLDDTDAFIEIVRSALDDAGFPPRIRRVVVAVTNLGATPARDRSRYLTFRPGDGGFVEDRLYRDLQPMLAKRLELWRLSRFSLTRLPSQAGVSLFHAVAIDQPKDERVFALAEVRDLTPVRDHSGHVDAVPELERVLAAVVADLRRALAPLPPSKRPVWNRLLLFARPLWDFTPGETRDVARRVAPSTRGLGLEAVVLRVQIPDPGGGDPLDRELVLASPNGRDVVVRDDTPSAEPIEPLTPYRQRVALLARRGLAYPYDLVRMIAPSVDDSAATGFPAGEFVEHDLDEEHRLVPVVRPPGENSANLVVGVITNHTEKHPEGMRRVIVLGDPSRSLGSLAEAECRRINAAVDLAESMRVPLEWFALSSGARISMETGTENMDWIGAVLRRLIEFTQAGHEVNVVVCGINVGAQPYWNAEATMLMHTRGILVMIPESAMVLTGKQSLDFSGGVSAEDNLGIGGFERVMGPNGQAQYWAPDLPAAARLLLHHYEHAYVAPGERFPRRADTTDPFDRDVRDSPHPAVAGSDFTRVGDIFSDTSNPGRKKPFDIRAVMHAATDRDRAPLERWARMAQADTVVVWDAHVGGIPVCMVGIEAHALPRDGFVPADGPPFWTSGTLFPRSSKKLARAVNSASGSRPLVVMANLSGFDGSPESMRALQLEYGAEIGRAVTNFRGPMVMVVVSRYHGGAFVVFSKALNERLEIAAVEGSYASVIGGAPAAAVVFAKEVDQRTQADPQVAAVRERLGSASGAEAAALRRELAEVVETVRSQKLGEVADEYDHIHDINRALRMGSVDRIIAGAAIRPYLIDALERGMAAEPGPSGPPAGDR
ncbi:MAG: fused acetyl/propionyl-CoA carboxylase subunit alpha/methylmalonyl-CoA decarboxylase subunit alpha [Acidimicrobiales bacterium]|nr:fused acetyl/propionyl-CoA carboxylase subunit alpha/methylmalonyl-CoA decarboxylase subunit alpha [Acidimicrobiales bacterium]